MGRLIILIPLPLGLLGCGPLYFPALWQTERPLLFPPDRASSAWAVGANLTAGKSLNSGEPPLRIVSASAGYCLTAPSRWLSLRASALGYAGDIGGEGVGGVGILLEPALNLPLGDYLSLSAVSEQAAAFEFGPYARRSLPAVSAGVGAGVTVHFSRNAHLTLVLPGTVRVGYFGSHWGIHASIGWGSNGQGSIGRGSIGLSYLLGEEPPAMRRRKN